MQMACDDARGDNDVLFCERRRLIVWQGARRLCGLREGDAVPVWDDDDEPTAIRLGLQRQTYPILGTSRVVNDALCA